MEENKDVSGAVEGSPPDEFKEIMDSLTQAEPPSDILETLQAAKIENARTAYEVDSRIETLEKNVALILLLLNRQVNALEELTAKLSGRARTLI
jgi:hypothetical protein